MRLRTNAFVLVASLALAVACSAPKKHAEPDAAAAASEDRPKRPKEPEKPWTTAFASKAALVCDEVTIEGPPELLNHVLVLQNGEFFDHEAHATVDGFLQLTSVKPDVGGPPPIRVRIDAWTIDVLTRVRVLERPGEVPVVVQVSGDVWFQDLAGGGEKRSAAMRFVGERP
ncbi:MAG: hypothetical protein K8S98_01140 [Planctomycetes bacterium]|nr:hypothetical protein [Planctomycetota bacterium]